MPGMRIVATHEPRSRGFSMFGFSLGRRQLKLNGEKPRERG